MKGKALGHTLRKNSYGRFPITATQSKTVILAFPVILLIKRKGFILFFNVFGFHLNTNLSVFKFPFPCIPGNMNINLVLILG